MKSIIVPLVCFTVLITIVSISAEVTAAAYDGILLCLKVVIPSLFPFFVICTYLNTTISRYDIGLLRPLGQFCKIPNGKESLLLIGFLGGYPVGAQCITQSYICGSLSKREAERMLGFCNNAGPAFIFGMLSAYFPSKYMLWLLWLVQIISSLITAQILPREEISADNRKTSHEPFTATDAVHRSIKAMTAVCSWVVLFKILISVLFSRLNAIPQWVTIPLAGILELVNGCSELSSIHSVGLRFVLSSAFLSFGGICVHMQTFAVTNGLQKQIYLMSKVLQTAISILISVILQYYIFPSTIRFQPSALYICTILSVTLLIVLTFFRKSSRFSAPIVIQ